MKILSILLRFGGPTEGKKGRLGAKDISLFLNKYGDEEAGIDVYGRSLL